MEHSKATGNVGMILAPPGPWRYDTGQSARHPVWDRDLHAVQPVTTARALPLSGGVQAKFRGIGAEWRQRTWPTRCTPPERGGSRITS